MGRGGLSAAHGSRPRGGVSAALARCASRTARRARSRASRDGDAAPRCGAAVDRERGEGVTALRVEVDGLSQASRGLRRFAAHVADWRPFWQQLGRSLAEDTAARWPLRRRTGRLRRSLTWQGSHLGRGGIFESSPDRLAFGSSLFYSRFHQHGTKRHAARPLIHVDEAQHTDQLASWLRARASAAGGLEIDQ